jgi:SAM-dependent methyltransferase
VAGRRVVEVGSLDVNGSVRPHVERLGPASYVGVDVRPGPGVDEVLDGEDLPGSCADLLICMEVLEHAPRWKQLLAGIWRALVPGGLLILTTRGPGFPRHDHPSDHWRFTEGTIARALTAGGWREAWIGPDPDPGSPGVVAEAIRGWARTPDLSGVRAQRAPR